MTRFSLILIFFSFLACNGNEKKAESIVFNEPPKALWITDERELPARDSLFYLDHPAPLFRKEFEADRPLEAARLYITAAGYYQASINGQRIGKNVLDPAWTDFSKRIYYTEYDVSPFIKEGDNCLGVSLGNGFYNPLPLQKWGRRNLRTDLASVGRPAFVAKLLLKYQDGESKEIVSDPNWKYAYGPLMKNSVYLGVAYDAGRELKGWDTPGYDDRTWQSVKTDPGPGGRLQKAFFPPVQITREITPVEIYAPKPGIWMVDMGENFTGTYRIRLSGAPGDTLTFRFGERIYADGSLNPMTTVIGQIKRKGVGGPGAPEIAWQTDSYIVGQEGEAWFSPEFTYHTYRYMEIAGLDEPPQLADIQGLFLHSNVSKNGGFSASSELLTSIQEATERTFLANLVSVQSDCPAREKFGYGGDLNASNESFIYNFDMQAFYRKTIYDWVDAMNDTGFVDTAPFVGIQYCGLSWESAFLITQYSLYLYYQDTAIIAALYDLDQQWMEKVARIHPEGMVEEGLSDHESLQPVPVTLTGTGHYLQCARIMQTFASVMGDSVQEKKYARLAEKLKRLLKSKFWDQPVAEEINRQTLFATLLYHDIVPEKERGAARDSLLKAVKNGPAGHFNTGLFGTKYVLETLSEQVSPQAVFDIVNSTAYPGWGFMIDRGATTIWETWKESDNVYSNCHPMFGTVTEWFYRWLGGIRPDPAQPGFEEFVLAPFVPEGLDWVKCTYHSPLGPVVSNWEKEPSGGCLYEMSIPEGSVARVDLGLTSEQKVTIKGKEDEGNPDKIEGLETGRFRLQPGDYLISVRAGE